MAGGTCIFSAASMDPTGDYDTAGNTSICPTEVLGIFGSCIGANVGYEA
jgi:hypothetical protein